MSAPITTDGPVHLAARPYTFTTIAETGGQFADFAPYVAALDNAGAVAFQATLTAGGTAVLAGTGGSLTTLIRGDDRVGAMVSHPGVCDSGASCVYTERADGYQGVFLARAGRLVTLAETGARFAAIGPLGPTMNHAGTVAFRATSRAGRAGVYTGTAPAPAPAKAPAKAKAKDNNDDDDDDGAQVQLIAEQSGQLAGFTGLPVVTNSGAVIVRAEHTDGGQGIYRHTGAALATVIDTYAPASPFTSLGLFPAGNDRAVVFSAVHKDHGPGIFAASDGRVGPVVTGAQAGTGFTSYRGALISDAGALVFFATPRAGQLGIYTGPDPVRDRILGIGDRFQSGTVVDMALNPVSINARGQLAIRIALDSDRQPARHVIVRADPAG